MNKPTIAFAQELLGYLPGRPDYNEWLTCISAIGNTFDESTALKLLSEKFKDEKPNEHLHKLNNRVKSTGFGSLVWLAKEYGYKLAAISRQKLTNGYQHTAVSFQDVVYTDELLYRFVNEELEERAAIYQYYDNISREEADNRVLQEFPDAKRERVYRVCINKEVIDKNLNRDNLPHLKANGNPDFEPLTTNFKNYYLTLQEIMEMVMLGFSIVFCSMKENEQGNTRRCSASFVEADLFALDFDKGIQIPDFIDLKPEGLIGIYTTCSHTEENHRFRAIFELPFCVKQGKCYSQIVKEYADFFNADKTTDCCRVFYGSSQGTFINCINGVQYAAF